RGRPPRRAPPADKALVKPASRREVWAGRPGSFTLTKVTSPKAQSASTRQLVASQWAPPDSLRARFCTRPAARQGMQSSTKRRARSPASTQTTPVRRAPATPPASPPPPYPPGDGQGGGQKIGRASCRERVWIEVVAV